LFEIIGKIFLAFTKEKIRLKIFLSIVTKTHLVKARPCHGKHTSVISDVQILFVHHQ